MRHVHLYATLTACEGLADAVAEALVGYGRAVSLDAGTVEFRAYALRDEPHRFHVHEIYVDDAAFLAHVASELAEDFNAAISPLIEGGESHLTFLTPVGPRTGGSA